MDERSAIVKIGGQEYEMLLTTNATKEIAGRYGGLDNLGDKLMKSENFEMALDKSCGSSHCYATRPGQCQTNKQAVPCCSFPHIPPRSRVFPCKQKEPAYS